MIDHKLCIVVQGPSLNLYINKIKGSWKDYPLIFSTWENADPFLYNSSDIVVYNKLPNYYGIKNYDLQRISTYNGILKAKELGYDRVFKWRSDFIPLNPDKLVSILDFDKINYYCWHKDNNGYFLDFFVEGKISDLLLIFKEDSSIDNINKHPEYKFTKKIIKNNLINKINLFGNLVDRSNEILWLKNQIAFSNHRKEKDYTYEIPQSVLDGIY